MAAKTKTFASAFYRTLDKDKKDEKETAKKPKTFSEAFHNTLDAGNTGPSLADFAMETVTGNKNGYVSMADLNREARSATPPAGMVFSSGATPTEELQKELARLRTDRTVGTEAYASGDPTEAWAQWDRQQNIDRRISEIETELKNRGADTSAGLVKPGEAAWSTFMKGVSGASSMAVDTLDFVNRLGHYALGWTPEEYDSADTLTSRLKAHEKANTKYWTERAYAAAADTAADRTAIDLGASVVQAIPAAVTAMLTGGGSLVGDTASLVAASNAAGATSWGGQLANTLRTVVADAVKNPQFYSSFWNVLGNGYENAKANGASDANAISYALVNGGINALIEISGGIENPSTGLVQTATEEGMEEVTQGIFERGLEGLYGKKNPVFSLTDENAVLNPVTSAKEYAGGAFVGGVLGGGQDIINTVLGGGAETVRATALEQMADEIAAVEEARAKIAAAPAEDTVAEPLKITSRLLHAIQDDPTQLAELGIDAKGKDGSVVRAEIRAALEAQQQAQIAAEEQTARAQRNMNIPSELGWYGMPDMAPVVGQSWYAAQEAAPAEPTPATPANTWYGAPAEAEYGNSPWYQPQEGNALYQLAEEMANEQVAQQAEATPRMQTPAPAPQAAAPQVSQTAPGVETAPVQKPAEAQKTPSVRAKNPGLVQDDMAKAANLTHRESRALDVLGKVIGKRIQFVESIAADIVDADGNVQRSGANAEIDGDTIRIALDSDDPFLTAAVHEVVHGVRGIDEDAYQSLARFVTKNMTDEKYGIAEWEEARKGYTAEQIPEEIVCEAFGRMLGDEAKLRAFVAENTTAAQRLMDALQDLLDKVRQIITGEKRENVSLTKNQLAVYKDLEGRLDTMLTYFTEALNSVKESEGAEASTDGPKFSRTNDPETAGIREQIETSADILNNMDVVASVSVPTEFQNKVSAARWAIDLLKNTGYAVDRQNFGRILFDPDDINYAMNYADTNAEKAAIAALPRVLKRGIEIGQHGQHKQRVKQTVTFAAPVELNGIRGNMAAVVNRRGNHYYAHRIVMPDGTVFKFSDKKTDAAREPSRGVADNSSLAKTTSATSNENIAQQEEKSNTQKAESAERTVGVYMDDASESAAPGRKLSLQSYRASDYVQNRDSAAKDLSDRLGVSIKKAKGYIDAVNSVAKMIADDRARLDYESSPNRSAFVGNTEYGGSIDFSTICKKRRLYTGTIEAIQKAMPNSALTVDEMLKIRAEMKARGYEVSCGLCYVEGSRVKIGEYTMQFLEELKEEGGYVPTMAEMNTSDGQERIRAEHPEVYDKYVKFMNKLAQRKPKLFQMATEYQGEILKKFRNDSTVEAKNRNGGLRIQSFSDFEIIHLIDCMQVIMDMSRVGLAGQAYTKVPDFAWALGKTGLKINLSLIAKGVDADGHIIYDEVEGMNPKDAKALRDAYNKNVGTILVVFNDQQLLSALNDDFVDFIIPFHRSQWNKGQYEMLGLPAGAKDYTDQQNEAYIERRLDKNGKPIRPSNYMPNEYWDFSKTGKQNAEEYLRMCAEDGRRPKFYKLLDDNGDGTYSLKKDGSTDGYWKLLIDFKMYDNAGKGSPQLPVRPEFNMTEAERMLNEYQGGHEHFPVAQDVVDDFVNKRFSRSGRDVLDEYVEQYGAIDAGEKPSRDITFPKRTTPKTKVGQTIRTFAEAPVTPENMLPTIENMVANHEFDYPVYGDDKAVNYAKSIIAQKGYASALADWVSDVSDGRVSKTNTALGLVLYDNAVTSGDAKTGVKIMRLLAEHERAGGQAVQAMRILKKLSPEWQLYNMMAVIDDINDDLVKRHGPDVKRVEIDEDLVDLYQRAKTQEQRDKVGEMIQKDVAEQVPPTFLDRWTAFRYTAMLGNPRTIIRNFVGNAGFAPVVYTKDAVATAIEAGIYYGFGKKLERTKGNVVGHKDLLKAARADYANVREEAMGESKYSDRRGMKAEIKDQQRIFGNTRSNVWNKTGGAALEAWRTATNKAMDRTDVWFNRPQYIFAMAQYCAANGISAEQIKSGKGLEKARAYAIQEAQKATYRDTNEFSQAVSDFGKKWLKSDNGWKRTIATLGEGLQPFRKTPANIASRIFEYSPAGLLKALSYDIAAVSLNAKMKQAGTDIKHPAWLKPMSGAEMIDDLSAGLTGTGLLALGVYLASQGILGIKLKGRGGSDDKKKKFMELLGHQDYAIELPDGTSVTLDWLAPQAVPMFIGANLWEAMQENNEDLRLRDVLTAIGNVSEPVMQMSMLQSLNDFFEASSYRSDGEVNAMTSKIASAATSYLTQAVPTLLGQIERTAEKKRMTTYTDKNSFLTSDMQYTLGKISAKVPIFDYNQIPYIDAWGREELSGETILLKGLKGTLLARALNNFISPGYISQVNESDMEKELERVYDATGEDVFPNRAAKTISINGEDKALTADEYVEYATAKGTTSYALVGKIVESAAYKAMDDEGKAEYIKDAYHYADQVTRHDLFGANYSNTYKWVEKAQQGYKYYGISPDVYMDVMISVSDFESLKDKNGNSIDNSKGLQIMQYIYNIPGLNDEKRKYLFSCYKDVGKTIIGYNKAKVNEELAKMKKQ